MKHKQLHIICKLCCLFMLLVVSSCKTTQKQVNKLPTTTNYLSSKIELTVPTKDAVFTVSGTMKLVSGERMQLSFLMPILRTEVARIEITPEELLLVDRMGKRYTRATYHDIRNALPRKATFANLEKMLFKAAAPNGKRTLAGTELGIPSLEKGKIELSDFSTSPFSLPPTTLSSKYVEVEPYELLEMLMSL
ncbi:MAG: DUF4292 domain-containing protein [Mediterranea massiliensis]|nr:DUF4292 domain-containing protein [Mediterranea massiliensis]